MVVVSKLGQVRLMIDRICTRLSLLSLVLSNNNRIGQRLVCLARIMQLSGISGHGGGRRLDFTVGQHSEVAVSDIVQVSTILRRR